MPTEPICWCDGDPTCHNLSAEGEYGLCVECRRLGHSALAPLSFSLLDDQPTVLLGPDYDGVTGAAHG